MKSSGVEKRGTKEDKQRKTTWNCVKQVDDMGSTERSNVAWTERSHGMVDRVIQWSVSRM